jgi:hypothetical protein
MSTSLNTNQQDNQNIQQTSDQNQQREYVGAHQKDDTRTSGHIQSLGQGMSSETDHQRQIGHHHYHDKDKGRTTDQNFGNPK